MSSKNINEDIKESLSSWFVKTMEKTNGRFFLLGMDIGKHCHSEDTYERISWLKRNLGNSDFLIDLIQKAEQDKLNCPNCNGTYQKGANYCSNCANKL